MNMFQKGFSTIACEELGYAEVISACTSYGLDGFELRLNRDGSAFTCRTEEDLIALKDAVCKAGLTISNLGSSVSFQEYDTEKLELVKQIIDTANILETRAVRIFLGFFSKRVNPELPTPDYTGIVKVLKELCAYGAEKNVEIWIETHNEFATGKVLKGLLKDVACTNLKIIWDIIHPIEDGETFEETWEMIGDSITHIHIKDGYDRKDPIWHDYYYTLLGEGELPVKEILNLLVEKEYQGFVSFEWESKWREELKDMDNSLDWVLKQFITYLDNWKEKKV